MVGGSWGKGRGGRREWKEVIMCKVGGEREDEMSICGGSEKRKF